MINAEQQSPASIASDERDLQLHSEEDSFGSRTPLNQNRDGLLFRALKYIAELAYPSKTNKSSECHQQHHHRLYMGGKERKAPRGVRIKTRIWLAVVLLYCNRSKSLAFSLNGLSKRRLRHMPSIATRISIFKECRELQFLFSVGMNQDGDSMSENHDQEENDDNTHREEDLSNHLDEDFEELKRDYTKRITRLEDIVSRQEVELHRLKKTCAELSEVSQAFGQLLQLLREAGLDADSLGIDAEEEPKKGDDDVVTTKNKLEASLGKVIESYDDAMIFGTAPTSVIDAADGAGAAILAAMLGGKQRMLVDVRDAELSNDPEILVQFIELAILPIAAGLEGLKSQRNRVKIVFPKVSQLLEYRRTMALAAPEVVALSTLGFDPVEKRDKLVVIVAPQPDDEEGIQAIRDILTPSEEDVQPIHQPVVILNYHMLPFTGVDLDFETVYHLRLLAVQYMADINAEEVVEQQEVTEKFIETDGDMEVPSLEVESVEGGGDVEETDTDIEDEALESAMKHAHEVGVNEGITRAMVIRAYPRPWHIFVDLSPNTNADFEVAATFDKEPTMDELNFAIVECLEGSEREDEIVAQQMQQALEDGQLNQVSDLISDTLDKYLEDDDDETSLEDNEDDDFDMFEEDSV
jgi:hypothetical protein